MEWVELRAFLNETVVPGKELKPSTATQPHYTKKLKRLNQRNATEKRTFLEEATWRYGDIVTSGRKGECRGKDVKLKNR